MATPTPSPPPPAELPPPKTFSVTISGAKTASVGDPYSVSIKLSPASTSGCTVKLYYGAEKWSGTVSKVGAGHYRGSLAWKRIKRGEGLKKTVSYYAKATCDDSVRKSTTKSVTVYW